MNMVHYHGYKLSAQAAEWLDWDFVVCLQKQRNNGNKTPVWKLPEYYNITKQKFRNLRITSYVFLGINDSYIPEK